MKNYPLFFKNKMILLYSNSEPVKSICRRYKVSKSTLYRWINMTNSIKMIRKHDKIEEEKVITLLNNGIPIKIISERFKICKSTLYYWQNKQVNNNTIQSNKYANDLHVIKLYRTIEILRFISPVKAMKTREKFEAIRSLSGKYNLSLLCEVFHLSKSTYYRYSNMRIPSNELRDKFLRDEILEIYRINKKRIGGTKIRRSLIERGITVSEKKVYNLMNQLHISKQTKKVNPYLKPRKNTNSKCKNILKQRFNPLEPNLVWVTDVTEIKIRSKPIYLCVIMDLFARKVIGNIVSLKNNTRLAELTFNHALTTRSNKVPVIFHSDRGSIYTSYKFRQLIQKYHITQSFSKPGYPYDNSPMESFFSQFKRESKQSIDSISTIKDYKQLVIEYIAYYNELRFHRGIGLMTPNTKEELYFKYYIKNSKPLK